MFQQYDDKQWAFTDCTSFMLMRQHNLHRAFAFDHCFEQSGFQLWPGMEG
jgi:predicted nucleic acid-binding protein